MISPRTARRLCRRAAGRPASPGFRNRHVRRTGADKRDERCLAPSVTRATMNEMSEGNAGGNDAYAGQIDFERFFDLAVDVLVVTRPDGYFQMVNQAFA